MRNTMFLNRQGTDVNIGLSVLFMKRCGYMARQGYMAGNRSIFSKY